MKTQQQRENESRHSAVVDSQESSFQLPRHSSFTPAMSNQQRPAIQRSRSTSSKASEGHRLRFADAAWRAAKDDGHYWQGHAMPEPGHPQPAEISFRLCGGSYALSLREFALVTGLYTEAETDMPIYMTAIHTVDDAVDSAWWPQIGDEPFVRSARVTRIRDPLIRYLHRCIASSITGRDMSQEWCPSHDLFYLYCLLSGRPCHLARCLAEYFSTYYHRQERGKIYGGCM
ncbi:hypothetical protein R6Q59_029253 [Mikania micrantha]